MRSAWLAVWVTLACAPAGAASLIVDMGQLVGADGVEVGGTLYDVRFAEGSCIDLFEGCDTISDFDFPTLIGALLAAEALLDQVFLDGVLGNFDTDPTLTLGCETTPEELCITAMPVAFFDTTEGIGEGVEVGTAFNETFEAFDRTNALGDNRSSDTTTSALGNYALWSSADSDPNPVPES